MRRWFAIPLALGLTLSLAPVCALAEEVSPAELPLAIEADGTPEDAEQREAPEGASSVVAGDTDVPQADEALPASAMSDETADGGPSEASEPDPTDGTQAEEPSAQVDEMTWAADGSSATVDDSITGDDDAAGMADASIPEDGATTDVADGSADDEEILPAADETLEDLGDSVLTIAPASNSKLTASVSKGTNAESVTLTSGATLLGEYWRVVGNGDGSYRFSSLLGGRWLSYSGAATSGTKVVIGSNGADWTLEDHGNGEYSLIPLGYDGLRLALSGDASVGATLQLATASVSSAAQRFLLTIQEALTQAIGSAEAVSEGFVTLESDYRSGKVVEVRGNSTDNSASIIVYASNSGFNQKFVLSSVDNNLYTLQATNSGKLVEVRGGSISSGASVTQYARNGKLHQLWYFVKDGSGYSIRNAKSGLALDASNSTMQVKTAAMTDAERTRQRFLVKGVGLLEDGSVFRIAPSYATSLQMTVAGNSAATGANVELAENSTKLGQYWRVKAYSDGSFTLVNLRSSKTLASKGSAKHKADVQVSNTSTGTKWVITVNDDGTFTIRPKDNDAIALDIPRASSAAGANIWLYNVSSEVSKAQRFSFTLQKPLTEAARAGNALGTEVYAILLTSSQGKGFNIRRSSMDNSTQVILYTAGSGLNEKFQLTSAGNGLYTIQAANSGKYLELKGAGTTAGTKVQQYSSNSKLHQYWYLVKDGSGYSIRSAKSGLAMALDGGKTSNGTGLVLAAAKSESAQRFTFKQAPLVPDGSYGIAASICTPLVLDVSKASTASGGNVIVYIANGKKNQQFTFKRQSDGSYTIMNVNSGRYLEVKDSSTSEGANIQQGTNSASSAQKWKIEVSPQGGLAFKSVKTGKYLEFKNGAIRLSTNVQQTSKNNTMAASFVTVKAGYNPVVGKIGWQNPDNYPQVSRYTVVLPSYAQGTSHSYVSPSTIRVDATREECIEVFIARAYDYLNAGSYYREPWAKEPGGGIDCSGLVLQCLYATGMDLEHAAGTEKVGGYNPYNHATVAAQTYNSARWYENKTFKPVSTSVMERGDLVYYGYYDENGKTVITHVAIYLGNGRIIHSTNYDGSGNKVRTDSVYIWNPIGAQRPFV